MGERSFGKRSHVGGRKWAGQEIRDFKDEWINGSDNPYVGREVMSSLCVNVI